MLDLIRVNGAESHELAITDRGLCYGDGLFETIKVIQNKPLLWGAHIARLQAGCTRLGIPINGLEERFSTDLKDLLSINPYHTAVLKLTVTRGSGPRGYFPLKKPKSTTITALSEAADFTQKANDGVTLRWCSTPLSINPLLAGMKHLNRLEQVLARQEWDNPHISEGLMRDPDGYLVEGTMSNLFWCKQGQIYTPELDRCGVAGVLRQTIIDIAAVQLKPVKIGRFTDEALSSAEEIFICNSLIDIWPVVQLDSESWDIGPLTQQLQTLLKKEYNV
ncbi:aminodeoxychorismate lyase [Neptunomonas japonica]|uniref:aminodeoxychorismate lyase n=1 Tax=Neptunomonas japonica TaxID=417574 RepID=UPI00040648AA|nr:aminodeoxychorismate lyase [Neptunomonas japonica]